MPANPKSSAKAGKSDKSQPSATRDSKTSTQFQAYSPVPFVLPILVQVTAVVGALSLATYASQLALHPLYGSTTSSLHFKKVVLGSAGLAMLRPDVPSNIILLFLGVVLSAAPISAKLLGGLTSRWHDPIWGPVATQLVMAAPVVGLGVTLVRNRITVLFPRASPIITRPFASLFVATSILILEPFVWQYVPSGDPYTSCNIFIALGTVASVLSGLTTPLGGSTPSSAQYSLLRAAIPLTIPLFLAYFSKGNAPCSHPTLPAMLPAGNSTVNLLARADSITGTIVVAEDMSNEFRVLRADHSLLGGVWIGKKTFGKPLGDSIYAAFVLQEAIRLVEKPEVEENALIIGLGTGIAAQALMTHKIQTTIVEIDPAVYKFAREYFGLQEPYAAHLTDARGWVHNTAQEDNSAKYSMIIHDCFSGGGVPSHIFTLEFWDDIKAILHPTSGVLAVNFAGHLGSNAAKAIYFTLTEAFGTCRVFHDRLTDDPNVGEDEFLNMVFFCVQGNEIKLRTAANADFLNSHLRYFVLKDVEKREVQKNALVGNETDPTPWLLTDANNQLDKYQHESAVEHWSVMRTVLPDAVWEIY